MDKTEVLAGRRDWSWMPAHMPKTVALLREYRELGEGAHLDECWLRGVLQGQPGWFYAVEGPLSVGTPFVARPQVSMLPEMERRAFELHGVLLQLAPLPGGPFVPPIARARVARAVLEVAW
jgi:hypothetical protein